MLFRSTQNSGGSANYYDSREGVFGQGGEGSPYYGRGGGGGGDYYGGGGGGGRKTTTGSGGSVYYGSGGGGGSGYVGGVTNGQTIAGNQSFPAPGGGNETGHSGNGYARITLVE